MSEVTSGNLVDGTATITWPDRYQYLTVENNDSAGLWVTADGSPAVPGGDDVDVIAPASVALVANGLPVWYQGQGMTSPGTVINLASDASPAAAYSVAAAG